jgi:fructose-1,6-bisphosphatase I
MAFLGGEQRRRIPNQVRSRWLDVIANEVLLRTLGGREGVAIVASEENEEPVILREDHQGIPRYCVLFDPLDGSSNLDVCGGVGTIFSILAHDGRAQRAEDSLLQAGARQIAAGYVLYGSSTVFVLTIGTGVDMFVLDPSIGAFMRVEQKMYEANPMAMLVEQAGGKAVAGPGQRILDILPTAIHQRTPVILGAADQVDAVLAHLKGT